MTFEGQEKSDFWSALGGKEEYASSKRLQEETTDHPIRLFQCSNASGSFSVDEIPEFHQVKAVLPFCTVVMPLTLKISQH